MRSARLIHYSKHIAIAVFVTVILFCILPRQNALGDREKSEVPICVPDAARLAPTTFVNATEMTSHAVPPKSFTVREYETNGAKHLSLRRTKDDRLPLTDTKPIANGTPNILFLVIVNDENSWGKNNFQPRSLKDFLALVRKTKHSLWHASIGVLTSSLTEYARYSTELSEFMLMEPVTAITLIYQNNFETEAGSTHVDDADRHREESQSQRRPLIARLRNYLMITALDAEDAVFWLDADVYDFSDGLLHTMLAAGKDIITARCQYALLWPNYDLNAWIGPRKTPTPDQLYAMRSNTSKSDFRADVVYNAGGGFLDKFYSKNEPSRIDSVGGTSLLIRADLVRQGVIFPPYYVVGTTWDYGGWDGVETEGMCYVAKMLGYECWALPWQWKTKHLWTG